MLASVPTFVRRLGCALALAAACSALTPTAANAVLPGPGRRTPVNPPPATAKPAVPVSPDRPVSPDKPVSPAKPAEPKKPKPFDSVSSGAAIVAEAARFAGKPYRYGAEGPAAYDCSSYTRAVFRHFGIELPRTSAAQHLAVTPVATADRRPGDLIFFLDAGGRVFHLGIYAGGGSMWVAPSTGKAIMRQGIWSARVTYGRAHS